MRFHCFSVFSQASCRFERPVANALEQFKQLKPTHEMFDSCRNCGALQEGHENASVVEVRVRQGVRDLYFRALPLVSMVFQYEVYHPWAAGLEVTVFVVQRRVYLASSLLCFVGVVVGALLDDDVRCPVLRGTLPVRHGLGRLGECRDGRGQWGFSDLGHHAGVCREVPVYCERPRLVGVVGVREGQRERLFDLGYRFWMYGSGVVPEGVLGGVPVCSGGTSRGLHCLRREGVVEGNLVEAVGFSGPLCLPFRHCGVVLCAV